MNIHNIGGLRRIMAWETADIAVLIFVYNKSELVAQKVGFLQSKRLYPLNNDVDDDDPTGFAYGMNAFLRRDPRSALARIHREFVFDANCIYGALKSGAEQLNAIESLHREFGDAVYFLFYNPPILPTTIRYPVVSRQYAVSAPLGCRVYSTPDVRAVVDQLQMNASPTVGALEDSAHRSNWRLETWAADLLLTCEVGQPFGKDREILVSSLLERRSGPIASAIAVSIELGAVK